MPGMSDALAAALAPMTVLDERGHAVPLGGQWKGRPIVLTFVRHFG
jgi:hypothetical protein